MYNCQQKRKPMIGNLKTKHIQNLGSVAPEDGKHNRKTRKNIGIVRKQSRLLSVRNMSLKTK